MAVTGCAHTVVIETEPQGALVKIDGQPIGEAPVVTEQRTSTGSRMHVEASADGYEPRSLVVTQSDWFLWPAVLAAVPAFGVPFIVIPFIGPFITVGWALVTSPALISLAFMQKYPDVVTIRLQPRVQGGVVLPTDSWLLPDDVAPNPPPLSDPLLEKPPQPDGANPVP